MKTVILTEYHEAFVANDGGRWFVMLNHDTEDAEGNFGMWTEYVCDPHGYDSRDAAEAALSKINN